MHMSGCRHVEELLAQSCLIVLSLAAHIVLNRIHRVSALVVIEDLEDNVESIGKLALCEQVSLVS